MLLKKIALDALSQPDELGMLSARTPMLVKAAHILEASGVTIEKILWNALEVGGHLVMGGLKPPPGYFEDWAERLGMPWLILVDGIDEIPDSKRSELLYKLEQFVNRSNTTQLILGSRDPLHFSQPLLDKAVLIRILDLSESEQAEISQRILKEEPEKFRSFLDYMNLSCFLKTPLLTSITAFLYSREGTLPNGRGEVFENVIDHCISNMNRRMTTPRHRPEVVARIQMALDRLALKSLQAPSGVSQDDAQACVALLLRESEPGLGAEVAHEDASNLLKAISVYSGIMRQLPQTLEWKHALLRDFLASRCLSRELNAKKRDLGSALSLWKEPYWANVIVFLLGAHSSPQRQKEALEYLLDRPTFYNSELQDRFSIFLLEVLAETGPIHHELDQKVVDFAIERQGRSFLGSGTCEMVFRDHSILNSLRRVASRQDLSELVQPVADHALRVIHSDVCYEVPRDTAAGAVALLILLRRHELVQEIIGNGVVPSTTIVEGLRRSLTEEENKEIKVLLESFLEHRIIHLSMFPKSYEGRDGGHVPTEYIEHRRHLKSCPKCTKNDKDCTNVFDNARYFQDCTAALKDCIRALQRQNWEELFLRFLERNDFLLVSYFVESLESYPSSLHKIASLKNCPLGTREEIHKKLADNNSPYWSEKGRLYLINSFEKKILECPEDLEIRFKYSKLLSAEENFDGAIENLNILLNKKESIEFYEERAWAHFFKDNDQCAVEDIEKALAVAEKSQDEAEVRLWYIKGYFLYCISNYKSAFNAFSISASLNGNLVAQVRKFNCLLKLGFFDGIYDELEFFYKQDPKDSIAIENLALYCDANNLAKKALGHWEDYLELCPDSYYGYMHKAETLYSLGDLQEFNRTLEVMADLDPTNFITRYLEALSHHASGQPLPPGMEEEMLSEIEPQDELYLYGAMALNNPEMADARIQWCLQNDEAWSLRWASVDLARLNKLMDKDWMIRLSAKASQFARELEPRRQPLFKFLGDATTKDENQAKHNRLPICGLSALDPIEGFSEEFERCSALLDPFEKKRAICVLELEDHDHLYFQSNYSWSLFSEPSFTAICPFERGTEKGVLPQFISDARPNALLFPDSKLRKRFLAERQYYDFWNIFKTPLRFRFSWRNRSAGQH